MSTLERIKAHRTRLLQEVAELDAAIKVMEKFKASGEVPEVKKVKTRKGTRAQNTGKYAALKAAIKDAIIKNNGQPVTKAQIIEEVGKYGYSLADYKTTFAQAYYPEFRAESKGHKSGTIWYSDRPRPEKEEWKSTLVTMKRELEKC